MKERPILFSSPMVRAVLDGSKTQTRRVAKGFRIDDMGNAIIGKWNYGQNSDGPHIDSVIKHKCPYGKPGDRLWVREAWSHREYGANTGEIVIRYIANGDDEYRMTCPDDRKYLTPTFRNRPSIHMPRWASRITLEIADIRVERLDDISANDCYEEGVSRPDHKRNLGSVVTERDNARSAYRAVWETINGQGSWAVNPWVWCVSFRRVTP